MEFKSATNLADFLAEKYQSTPETFDLSVQENPDIYDFVEEYLTWLRVNERGAGGNIHQFPYEATMQNYYGFDDLGTGLMVPGAVRVSDTLEDGKLEVVNQFESPEYLELVTKTSEFREKGFITSNAKEHDITADSNWKPGYKIGQVIKMSASRYYTAFNIGSMNAISTTSKNPARAMKFLELMGTRPQKYTICCNMAWRISIISKIPKIRIGLPSLLKVRVIITIISVGDSVRNLFPICNPVNRMICGSR